MKKLSLNMFISATKDLEADQYQVLHGLKSCYAEFSRNRLYPMLSELIELISSLETILQEKENLEKNLPRRLKDIDLQRKQLIFEPVDSPTGEVKQIIDLISWALPHLLEALRHGKEIYEFVDKNIAVEQVGILPLYRDEGYCFIPEHRAYLLHVIRYETSLFVSGNERFRTLKTRTVRSLQLEGIRRSLESIKLELIKEHHDLPTPATFTCETDLDFPFAETILPVAKRKLMKEVLA